MDLRRLLFVIALPCGLLSASPALAADAPVDIPSRAANFTPRTVTIASGDTVTWHWTGPANERNHSPASDPGQLESWDADPGNPKPDFDHGAGHTFTSPALIKAGNFTYHCKVHADMTGTVIVTGAPVPSYTVPSPSFAGDLVSFDGSGSTDNGTIAKYEWDLDGDGSFETNTGTTPSSSKTYAAPATMTTRLRVTDDVGNVRETIRPLTILTRAPSASFTVAPGTVAKNATVSLDASASAATAGRTITNYAWDLDGNGSFETDGGTTPTTTTTYPAAGPKSIGLQVTDSAADASSTTRTLTVSNVLPTATFTISNTAPAIGVTVSFDATGSADPDGTVASFAWDLDGNGTFETNTGTTPTTSKAYSAAGAVSVKLRVTDNDGGTTDLAKTVTVPSPPPPPPSSSPPPSSAPPSLAPAPAPQQTTPAAVITAPLAAVTPAAKPAVLPAVAPKPAARPKAKPKKKKKASKRKKRKAKKKKR